MKSRTYVVLALTALLALSMLMFQSCGKDAATSHTVTFYGAGS